MPKKKKTKKAKDYKETEGDTYKQRISRMDRFKKKQAELKKKRRKRKK